MNIFKHAILYSLLFTFSVGHSQDLKWIYKVGGTTAEYGVAVGLDNAQNVYDVTNFTGSVVVNGVANFNSLGQSDIIIRKSTTLGFIQWAKQLGSPQNELSYDLSVDKEGNSYIIGTFQDSLILDDSLILQSNTPLEKTFVLKINTNGELIWAKHWLSDINVIAKSIVTLGDSIIIGGNFSGTTNFEINSPTFSKVSEGGSDIFVLTMHAISGAIIQVESFGGIENDNLFDVKIDSAKNIILAGDFRSFVDFDPNIGTHLLTSSGNNDAFILKLNFNLEFVWAKKYGSSGNDSARKLAIDQFNNYVFTGSYSETVNFGDSILFQKTSAGSTDIFVAKIDENGNSLWVNSFGSSADDVGNNILINAQGVIFAGGEYRGTIDFDIDPLLSNTSTSAGGSDMYFLVLNQDGTYNQHFALGGLANEQLNDFTIKTNGELISVGGFGAIVDFDPTSSEINVISSGGLDAFIVNIDICVNPYIKTLQVVNPTVCIGGKTVIRIVEGYLNDATQWSWQKNDCDNITFASGSFIEQVITDDITYYLKGYGGCIFEDQCKAIPITIFTDSIIIQNIDLCQGDTLFVGSSYYTTQGNYVDTLQAIAGCDSIIFSNVSVFPNYSRIDTYDICSGDTVLVGNSVYTLSGTYVDLFTSINGCDSTIISVVNILPSLIDNADVLICQGDSVTVGNTTYYQAGTYIQTTINSNGCEDILIVKVTVVPTNINQIVQLCEGDSLVVGSNIYKLEGVYTDTIPSFSGCDSIVTSIISIRSISITEQSFTFCSGDSIVVGSQIYKETGNYLDTLTNLAGCDSLVYTSLRVYDVPEPQVTFYNLCEGDTLQVGSSTYFAAGRYVDTLSTQYGCDSILISDIDISQKLFQVNSTICHGDSILFGDGYYHESGDYYFEFQNIFGCDSILVFSLTVLEEDTVSQTLLTCPGQSVMVGDSVYMDEGIYYNYFVDLNGCDSVVITNVVYNHVFTSIEQIICEGDSVSIGSQIFKTEGLYSITLDKSDGCDSIISLQVNVLPNYRVDTLFEICLGDQVQVGNSIYFNDGNYAETLQSINGCDSIVYFQIQTIQFKPLIYAIRDTLFTSFKDAEDLQWYRCGNDGIIPIENQKDTAYIFETSGFYTLSATFKGCTYFSDCLEFIISSSDDIDNINFEVFPNPVLDNLTILAENESTLLFRNIQGAVVKKHNYFQSNSQIYVGDLVKGIYIVECKNKNKSSYIKIIKM